MALDEIGLELTREDFLRLWLPRLNAIWEAVCAGETSDLRAEWDRRSVLRRQPVRWQDSTGSSRSGTAGRLRKDGALEVVTDRGDSLALYAGDVHLLDGEAGEER